MKGYRFERKRQKTMIKQTEFEIVGDLNDPRGQIKKIAQNVDVLNITSAAGTKRAAHYHRQSSHLCRLNKGKMHYYERLAGSQECPKLVVINPGDYFFTGPVTEHLMSFVENSEFDCYSFGSREQENYENDLVRLDFDLEEIYKAYPYQNG